MGTESRIPAAPDPIGLSMVRPPSRVVLAVSRPDSGRGVALLSEAGFPPERIEVIIVEDIPRLEERLGGTGLHRYLVRLKLLHGDDLDELEPARQELMRGHALIQVHLFTIEERHRAQLAFDQRESGQLQSFGLWTTASTDDPGVTLQ